MASFSILMDYLFFNRIHLTSVMIYYDHYFMATLRRNEQYTRLVKIQIFLRLGKNIDFLKMFQSIRTDFLAVCGGLLGLCLGVSALSIIECLYFLTLRLYWSIYRWKSKKTIVPIKHVRRIKHISIDMAFP